MKAKTRILAILLTVLMVGGLLPLSIFAAGGEKAGTSSPNVPKIEPDEMTLEDINKEFAESNLSLAVYQDFDKWQMDEGSTEYVLPAESFVAIGTNADVGGSLINVKNVKQVFSIRKEADGNKALYMGTASKGANNNDNFIDIGFGLPHTFSSQQGNGTHDLYISADFKMDGKNIIAPNDGIFGLLYRINNGTPSIINTVSVSEVGGLYIGGSQSPDNLIGFLSSEEYTRLAVSIDRLSNKYYVYVNGVLANPEGTVLFSNKVINDMNSNNQTGNGVTYTAQNLPICNIRMYTVENNINSDEHKGLYIDNILAGARLAVSARDNAFRDVYTSSFPANLVGTNVSVPLPGTTSNTIGVIWPGAITYIQDEEGDVAMQWHYMPRDTTTDKDQAYFQIGNNAARGANLRLSMDLKLGADGVLGSSDFIFYRSSVKGNTQEITVKLESNGNIVCDNNVLGTITKEKYSNLRIDIICNAISGNSVFALMFFDDILVYTKSFTLSYAGTNGYGSTDFHPALIRIYSIYDNGVEQLKPNDLILKNLSLVETEDYNDSGLISIFEKNPEGFAENAGITRYYGEEGVYVSDFEYNGEKYIVGYNGIIIGKESDGIEFAPYAPYTDWDHTGTMIYSGPNGEFFTDSINGVGHTIFSNRDGFRKKVTMDNGDGAVLYTSYYDADPGTSPLDHASYLALDFQNGLKNTSVVIDFDVMMGEFFVERPNSNQAFIYLKGQETVNNGGGRKDYDFPIFLNGDGWITYNGEKVYKIGKREFTRFSIVVHGPQLDGDNLTKASCIDIYANGVLLVEGLTNPSGAKYLQQIRMLKIYDADAAMYYKDMYMYSGEKPQQFISMVNGVPTLTEDNSLTPAVAKDIKSGFVSENGVLRYYRENGLPVIATENKISFTDQSGRNFKADVNGVVYNDVNIEALIDPGHFSLDFSVDFAGIESGDYVYSPDEPRNANSVFGLIFNQLYFNAGEYDAIKFDVYIPENTINENSEATYNFEFGESQRFYKVKWLGGTTYEFGDGTYFIDDVDVPEGAIEVEATGSGYTLINDRGGKRNIVCFDTDDVEGVSYNDTFYVRTRNYVKVLEGSAFGELQAGWNTIEIPIIENGEYDIDYLSFVVTPAIDASGIKIAAVKIVKSTRFVKNDEAGDGIGSDGCYYKSGIAQTGWIDVNDNGENDAGDYYASPDTTKIVTGIYSIDGIWYKFDNDGKLIGKANGIEFAKNGVDKDGNVYYAYKSFVDGVIQTGLISEGVTNGSGEAAVIYTTEKGVSLQNVVEKIGDATYDFDKDGYGKLLCANEDAHIYGEPKVIKLATCQETGLRVYVCNVCGNEKTEDIPIDPNNHAEYDESGIATCCEGDVKADGVTSVYGHSLVIGENISIVFYLDITGTEGQIEVGRRSEFINETTTKVNISELEDVTIDEKTYKKISVSVAPNAVNAVVTVRYIRPDGTEGSSYNYQTQKYIDEVIKDGVTGEFSQEVIDLVKAFDAYAKNVNKVIYNDGEPDDISGVDEITFESNYSVKYSYNQKNAETNYIRLEKTYENIYFNFTDAMVLKVNFTLTGVSSDFKFYVNGEEVKGVLTAAGYHCVEVVVKASDIDELIEIKVVHAGGSEFTLSTSALAFAKRKFMSSSATDAEKNLMKAIYMYNKAIVSFLAEDAAE